MQAALSEVFAGMTVACVSLPLCVTAGVLTYGALDPGLIAKGAVAGVICAVIGGLSAALFRNPSFLVTIPTTPLGLVQASTVSALVVALAGHADQALMLLPLLVALVGGWQVLFGISGFARVIRFTPYPVIAGFATGIGLLMAIQQLPVIFGVSSLADILASASPARPSAFVFALLLVAFILAMGRLAPKLPNIFIGLGTGVAVYHLLRVWQPQIDLGEVVGVVPLDSLLSWPRIELGELGQVLTEPSVLQQLIFGSLTLAVLGALDTFFAMQLARQLGDTMLGSKREVIGQGGANLLSAMAGGLVVSTSLSVSAVNYRSGGRSRLSVMVSALALLLGVALVPQMISALPRIVLSAILIVIAARLFDHWIVQVVREAIVDREQRGRMILNLSIVLAVVVATVLGKPMTGVAAGIGLSCLVFIGQMARPVIGKIWSGDGIRSKRVRSQHQIEILRSHGARIVALDLQGVLFFGNAEDLTIALRKLVDTADIVLLDFRRVTEIDISGATMLQQIASRFQQKGKIIIASGVNRRLRKMVVPALLACGMPDIFPDKEGALEWAEQRLIEAHAEEQAHLNLDLEHTDLARAMSAEDRGLLGGYLERVVYPARAALCRAGDASDRMWIIRRGSVSARVPEAQGGRRLASLGPGCTVGEMGLLDRASRSADVVADDEVEAYMLTGLKFEALLRDHPRIGQAILTNIARQLAQRLRVTSEDLRLADQ